MNHLTNNPAESKISPETWGIFADMKVYIRSKEKCPVCGSAFTLTPGGLICKDHRNIQARHMFLDWYFQGEKYKLYGFDSFKAAWNKRSAIESEISACTFRPEHYKSETARAAKKFAFDKLYKDWLDRKEKHYRQGKISPAYLRKLKEYKPDFLQAFSGKDVRLIQKKDIGDFSESFPDATAAKTIKNKLAALHAFFSWCLDQDVLRSLPKFPRVQVPEKTPKWLDKAPQAAVYDALESYHKPIFLFMMGTGVRPGEARALQWSDVDMDNATVTIRHNFSEQDHRAITKGKRDRTLPLTTEVMAMLDTQPKTLRSQFVFTYDGHPYGDNLNRIWKRACTAAGIEGVNCYQGTRHSFASQLVNKNVSLAIIRDVLGHVDMQTTNKYAHVDVKGMREAME